MTEDLKNYDEKLVSLVLFNLAWLLILDFDIVSIIKNYEIITFILTVPIFYFPTYLVNNFIPENVKFIILYPFKDNHHYASDIFTKILNKDIEVDTNLINIELLTKKYGYIEDPNFEDSLWRELYEKHRYEAKVYQHHRQFLFCRDLTMISIPLFVVLIILDLSLPFSHKHTLCIIIISIVEWFVLKLLTEYQNKKFALSVLQEETRVLTTGKHKKRVSTKSKLNFN